jgi:hypothetical protein
MEPENQPQQPEAPPAAIGKNVAAPGERIYRWTNWAFIGGQGLRAGWSISIFFILLFLFASAAGFVLAPLHLVDSATRRDFTASSAFFSELIGFVALVGAAAVVAFIERRKSLLAFNLTGPLRALHFLGGLAAGFAALSLLVGAMALGGWLQFGPVALSGAHILKYGAMWAVAFLLVGCVEEGIFRGYLQFTLTRGINFWWALATVGVLCLNLLLRSKGNGVWGVYFVALLGLLPCLILQLRKTARSAFWQAAWVTSTLFGFIHTGNGGENWIGIFAAALIGFVFCVSVWVTGSAWWAIGCHTAWDWAETYFYGTADSGLVAKGHYLTTSPAGNPLWSGGADGPEGSLLVLGAVMLLLLILLVIYSRRRPAELAAAVAE